MDEISDTTLDCINKITDKIYLGDIDGAREVDYLKKQGIKHIINLAGNVFSPTYEEGLFIRKNIEIMDFPEENIFQYFKECIEFIEKADKIFVHCMAGVSRSASIVIAYIMWKEHKNYNEAYSFVKKYRFIYPNYGFVFQLKYFEKLLVENNYDLNKINFKQFDTKEKWNNFLNKMKY